MLRKSLYVLSQIEYQLQIATLCYLLSFVLSMRRTSNRPNPQNVDIIENNDTVTPMFIESNFTDLFENKCQPKSSAKQATWYIPLRFAPNTEPLEPQTQHDVNEELHSQCLCTMYPLLHATSYKLLIQRSFALPRSPSNVCRKVVNHILISWFRSAWRIWSHPSASPRSGGISTTRSRCPRTSPPRRKTPPNAFTPSTVVESIEHILPID